MLKKSINFQVFLGCLVVISLFTSQLGHSKIVSKNWAEDFEFSLSNWNAYAFYTDSVAVQRFAPRFNYTIENGMVTHPDLSTSPNDGPSFIVHSSDLAYGEWNVEYQMPVNSEKVYTVIYFIFNNIGDKNFQGFAVEDDYGHQQNVTGYGLVISGGLDAEKWYSQNATIVLIRFDPYKLTIGNVTKWNSPWDSSGGILGWYNNFPGLKLPEKLDIKVIRTIGGNFKVYTNSELILNQIDNTYNSSEYFVLGSWAKPYYADNITVSQAIQEPTTTNFIVAWPMIPAITVYTIFRRILNK